MVKIPYVGVIGSGECSESTYATAMEVGAEIGRRGWVLVCGGLGGVMEAAAKGCREAGGITVGILPGLLKESANPFISIAIATGMGEGRNLLVVRASDALVAVSGGYGTLSEIALGLKLDKPVIGLDTWKEIQGVTHASSPADALDKVVSSLSRG
jgi:uncharacterized protein (TIGR00725 family)